MWLLFYTFIWLVAITSVVVFAIVDFKNAFDKDPTTPTYSSYIRKWKHRCITNTVILWTALGILLLNPASIYLTLHLGFEVI